MINRFTAEANRWDSLLKKYCENHILWPGTLVSIHGVGKNGNMFTTLRAEDADEGSPFDHGLSICLVDNKGEKHPYPYSNEYYESLVEDYDEY